MGKSSHIFSTKNLNTYRNSLKNKGYSVATIKRKIASVLKFANWAYETGRIHHNQLQEIRKILASKTGSNRPNKTRNWAQLLSFGKLVSPSRLVNLLGLLLLLAFFTEGKTKEEMLEMLQKQLQKLLSKKKIRRFPD